MQPCEFPILKSSGRVRGLWPQCIPEENKNVVSKQAAEQPAIETGLIRKGKGLSKYVKESSSGISFHHPQPPKHKGAVFQAQCTHFSVSNPEAVKDKLMESINSLESLKGMYKPSSFNIKIV